jgi:hypothetical protein
MRGGGARLWAQALQLAPDYAGAHVNHGAVLYQMSLGEAARLGEAISAFEVRAATTRTASFVSLWGYRC